MTNTMICVGGPRAGERMKVQSGQNSFRVPVYENQTTDENGIEWIVNAKSTIRYHDVVYRYEAFHTNEGSVEFWTPAGQTPKQTMEILLASYMEANKASTEFTHFAAASLLAYELEIRNCPIAASRMKSGFLAPHDVAALSAVCRAFSLGWSARAAEK